MNTEEMLQEVDRRVADVPFLEHLLPKAVARHSTSKTQFRECDCSYCKVKTQATRSISNMVYPIDYGVNNHMSIWDRDYAIREIKRARRDSLREHYRNKLKEVYND